MRVILALGQSGISNFALVGKKIKKKMPSVSTNQHSVILPSMLSKGIRLYTISIFGQCSFFSVFGIVCNKCTPDQASLITCNTAKQLREVNCDNLNDTIPGTNVTIKYDTCISAKIVATLSGIQIPTYVMECAVKVKMHPCYL